MKIGIKVMPKKEILDSQGRAVEGLLREQGHQVSSCTVGRYVILDLPETQVEQALAHAKEIAEFILHNPLIEQFELECLGS